MKSIDRLKDVMMAFIWGTSYDGKTSFIKYRKAVVFYIDNSDVKIRTLNE